MSKATKAERIREILMDAPASDAGVEIVAMLEEDIEAVSKWTAEPCAAAVAARLRSHVQRAKEAVARHPAPGTRHPAPGTRHPAPGAPRRRRGAG